MYLFHIFAWNHNIYSSSPPFGKTYAIITLPKNKHGTWTCPLEKGHSFINYLFWGSKNEISVFCLPMELVILVCSASLPKVSGLRQPGRTVQNPSSDVIQNWRKSEMRKWKWYIYTGNPKHPLKHGCFNIRWFQIFSWKMGVSPNIN